jgi:hypothetical protein
MILDDSLTFADKQAIVASAAGTVALPLGTTIAQLNSGGGAGAVGGANAADIGKGEPVNAFARIGTAFNNLTSLDIEIQGCDDAAGANPVSILKKTVLLAALLANTYIPLGALPAGVSKKYLRAYFTVTGTAPTLGTITVGLVPHGDGKPQNDVFSA